MCEKFAQGRCLTAERPGVELATSRVASQRPNHYSTKPHKSSGFEVGLKLIPEIIHRPMHRAS